MVGLFFCLHRPCGNSRHPLPVQDIFYHHCACRDQATCTNTNAVTTQKRVAAGTNNLLIIELFDVKLWPFSPFPDSFLEFCQCLLYAIRQHRDKRWMIVDAGRASQRDAESVRQFFRFDIKVIKHFRMVD